MDHHRMGDNTMTGHPTTARRPIAELQPEEDENDHQLYYSWRPFLIIIKILGMFPLTNVTSRCGPQPSALRFLSLNALYSGAIFILIIMMTIFNFAYYFSSFDLDNLQLMFRNLSVPMYTLSAAMTTAFTLKLTIRLPVLFDQWDAVCNRLRKYCLKRGQRPFLTPGTVLLVTLAIYLTTAVHTCYRHVIRCIPDDFPNTAHYLIYNLHHCVPYVEYSLGSNLPSAIVGYVAVILTPLMWNVRDVTIILCSLTFRHNFKIIPSYLESIQRPKRRNLTRREWRTIREDHRAICNMVKVMDKQLCPLLLVSFTFNLYHILLDLYTFFT